MVQSATQERDKLAAPMSSTPAVELKSLTSLRFFAALMIAAVHLQEKFVVPWHEISDKSLRQGIAFFFVLSGFILTHVYIDQSGLTLSRFLALRSILWMMRPVARPRLSSRRTDTTSVPRTRLSPTP